MAWAEPLSGGGYRGGYKVKVDGKPVNRYVSDDGKGFTRKSDAKEAAEEAAVEARRSAAAAAGTPKSAKMPWGQWWDILVQKRYRGKVTDTEKREADMVRAHVRPRWGNVPLNQIKNEDVQEWVTEDLAPGREPSSVRTIYSVFSASVNAAVKKKPPLLHASPCVGIELPLLRRRRRKTQMSSEQETILSREPRPTGDEEPTGDAIGGSLHPRYVRAVRFQRRTGLRPGELGGLHADQIDFKRKEVTAASVYIESRHMIRAYPKDYEPREIPLTAEALDAAREALAGRDLKAGCGVPHADGSKCRSVLVFQRPRDDGVLTPGAYRRALRRACEKAGLPILSPYSIRRGFSTWAKDNGVDAFTIQYLMGHSKLEQTAEYVQFTPAARQQFLAAMGERGPLRVVGQNDERGADAGANTNGTTLDQVGPRTTENAG